MQRGRLLILLGIVLGLLTVGAVAVLVVPGLLDSGRLLCLAIPPRRADTGQDDRQDRSYRCGWKSPQLAKTHSEVFRVFHQRSPVGIGFSVVHLGS